MKLGNIRLGAYVDCGDREAWPKPQLGIGWMAMWFHSTNLVTLGKTIFTGPYFNLYIFIGSKVVTLYVEYIWRKEPVPYERKRKHKTKEVLK